jgi:hypothetical protein
MKQWKAMGEPPDTGSVMNILQDAGLSTDQIGQIGQAAQVDLGAGTEPSQSDEPGDADANAASTGDEKVQQDEPSADSTQAAGDQADAADAPKGIKGNFDTSKMLFYDKMGSAEANDPGAYPDIPAGGQVEDAGKTFTYVREPSGGFRGWKADDGTTIDAGSNKAESTRLGNAWRKANGFNAAPTRADALASVNLKTLADEIKQAGPEVIQAVKAMLTAEPAAQAA